MIRGLMTGAGLLLLAACGGGAPEPGAAAEPVLLEDIYVAYRDQPVVAVKRFGDGAFDIAAPIDSIELAGGLGELFLTGPSGTVAAVAFADPDGAQDALATMKRGEWVSVRCGGAKPLGRDMFTLERCAAPTKAPQRDPSKG